MANGQINRLLEFTDMQMAAEAFLSRQLDLVPNRPRSEDVKDRLEDGNSHASKFMPVQAQQFVDTYEVLAQYRNDTLLPGSTGFSATLFRSRVTDPARGLVAGELTLSIRSTEFIDDAVRDSKSTNELEVKELGWAFGHIAEMEQWYAQLCGSSSLLADGNGGIRNFNVTGYSLGGHLATAFNILRREESVATGAPNPIIATYTFNGAGTGAILNGRRLTDIISDFNRIRANYAASSEWTSLSQPVRDTYLAAAQLRVDQINAEQSRVAGLSGVTRAFGAPAPAGSQASLEYQIAALLVHQDTVGASNFPLPGGTNYFPSSPVYAPDALRFANMTEIVGMETGGLATSFISNSGIHYGYRQEVAIEAQPEIRGLFPILYLLGFNLLVDNPDRNSFADTHSLVLIVDSLSLMAAMEKLAPNLTIETTGQLLAAMSNAAASDLTGTQGKAEGDTLERTLDALRKLAFGPGQDPALSRDQMLQVLEGNTWHENAYRVPFQERLKDLRDRITALTALNETFVFDSLVSMSPAQLAAIAGSSEAIAYRYALRELSPFAVVGDTANAAIYSWHNLAGELDRYSADNRTGTLTTEWIADRTAFLSWKNRANTTNVSLLPSDQTTEPWRFVDLPQNYIVTIIQPGGTAIDSLTHRAVFGGNSADYVQGGKVSDRLYGEGSTDYLEGKGGNDYLEGGLGFDVYAYGGATGFLGNSNDGGDVIHDIDGKGILRYVYSPLVGSLQTTVMADASNKLSDTEWRSANGKFTYTTTPNDQGSTDLVVTINGDAGGGLTLKEFHDGDFGIRLWTDRPTPQTVVRIFYGDKEDWDSDPNQSGTQTAADGFGNFVRADGQNGHDDIASPNRSDVFYGALTADAERFILGENNDAAYSDGAASASSTTGSADWIQGGAGRDNLVSGPDNDLIEAGADGVYESEVGGDIAYGALGDDEIYGTDKIALAAAINAGDSDSPTALKGDLLSGGPGEDWLIAGAANDFLLGGNDRDLMIAGAGDDNIFGDGDVIALTPLWTAVRTITTDPETGTNTYALEINLNELSIIGAGAGGNDVIYAGGGSDWIFAHDGDDFVDGGSGNDIAFGIGGDDVLIGGLGDDLLVGDSGPESTAFGGDYLDGGAGNDRLHGDGGNDVLVGGAGDDTLTGGAGKDIYVFNKGDGTETIFDTPDDPGKADASVLVLGDGISRSDIRFFPGSLGIDLGPSNPDDPNSPRDAIHFEGFDQVNPDATPLLAEIRFGDGTSMSYADILAQGFDIDGTEGNDNGDLGEPSMLVGTGVTDRIYGFGGDDVLFGLGGNDLLDGGAGADELIGGAGNDTIHAGDDDDLIWADDDDLALAEHGADVLWGGLGNDNIRGYGGDDQLFGDDGGDTLWGEAGSDSIDGGAGDDFVFGDSDLVEVVDQGNDTLSGGDGNDQLVGFGGNDALYGGAGGDALFGGADDDQVSGDEGNDTLWGEHGADLVEGGAGNDFVYGDALYMVLGVPIINFFDDNANDTLGGGDGDDTLNSGGGDDLLDGGSGDDLLEAEGGNDTLAGGEGGDTLRAGADNDVIGGGTGNDVLLGEAGDDLFLFDVGDGEDSIREQPDTLLDVLRFGASIDAGDITFSRGTDTALVAWHANNVDQVTILDWYLGAGYGLDHFEFADGTQITAAQAETSALTSFRGGSGNDTLLGSASADMMHGMAGADALVGYASNDTLIGGTGNDTLTGGDGGDVYRIALGDGADLIQETGQYDDALVFDASIASTDISYDRVGNDLVMRHVNGSERVTVSNWFAHIFSYKLQSVSFASDGTSYSGFELDTLATVIPHQYTLNLDDGAKLIEDWGGIDTLTFGSGIAKADIQKSRVGVDLVLTHVNGSDSVTIKDWFDSTSKQIEEITFAGTSESYTQAELTDPFLTLTGTAGNDLIAGGNAYGETIIGLAGNDQIYGLGGADLVTGGLGNDTIYGGAGGDRFFFRTGDGADTVTEEDLGTIVFGPGMVSNVNITSISGGRLVTFAGSSDSVRLLTSGFASIEIKFELNGTSAANTLVGSAFGDVVQALEGNDSVVGAAGSDEIYGGTGNDTLEGGRDIDHLYGETGDDVIDGGSRTLRDTDDGFITYFHGGPGNDTLYGDVAGDQYFFNLGDGQDVIVDEPYFGNGQWYYSNFDALNFGAGITEETLSAVASGSDLVVTVTPTDRVTLRNWMSDFMYRVDAFTFSDGPGLNTSQIMDLAFTQRGTSGNDTLTGGTSNDKLYGLGGNDILSGLDGNDFLDGGAGNDTLNGGNGDDRYAFGVGGGQDRIGDAQGTDRVEFAAGVTASQITISRSLNSLVLGVTGTSDTLAIDNFLVDSNARVEDFAFTDGSMLPDTTAIVNNLVNVLGTAGDDVLQGTDAFDVLYGYAGNDTLTALGDNDTAYGGPDDDTLNGGAGNDNLQGEAGNDTYNYALGGGSDVVSDSSGFDVVAFGAGIANTAVTSTRSGSALVLGVNVTGNTGQVTVQNYFSDQETEEIRFADGTVWDVATVRARVLAASSTAGSDLIFGYESNDTINSLAGNDTVYAGAGNDVVDGGSGSDTLYGEDGNDNLTAGGGDAKNAAVNNYLYGGAGDDVLVASAKTDFLYGDAGNDILRGSGSVNVMSDSSGNNLLDAQGGNDALSGGDHNDLFIGGTGNDSFDGDPEVNGLRGSDIIAFNKSDGQDSVLRLGSGSTITIGGGTLYGNLTLEVQGAALRLKTASSHYISLNDWYSNPANKAVSTLQIVIEGTRDYKASSSNPMNNRKIQTFDFLGLVAAFDAAGRPSNFSVAGNLPSVHIGGSDTEAIGGAVVYQYARTGSINALTYDQMRVVISAPEFGVSVQPILAASAAAVTSTTTDQSDPAPTSESLADTVRLTADAADTADGSGAGGGSPEHPPLLDRPASRAILDSPTPQMNTRAVSAIAPVAMSDMYATRSINATAQRPAASSAAVPETPSLVTAPGSGVIAGGDHDGAAPRSTDAGTEVVRGHGSYPDLDMLAEQWFSRRSPHEDLSLLDEIWRAEAPVNGHASGSVAAAWEASHRWLAQHAHSRKQAGDADANSADLSGLSLLSTEIAHYDMPRAVVGLQDVAGHQLKTFRGLREGMNVLSQT